MMSLHKILNTFFSYFFNFVSRSSLSLKSILKMPGLEPRTSRSSMLRDCAYHLRYISADPSAQTHSISGPGPGGRLLLKSSFKNFSIFLFPSSLLRLNIKMTFKKTSLEVFSVGIIKSLLEKKNLNENSLEIFN